MLIDRRTFTAAAFATSTNVFLPRPALGAAVAQPLRPAAMQADLRLLVEAYEQLHPGLTRYMPRGGFSRAGAAARDWAARERSPGDFYLALARLTARVRCGHSFPNPVNQTDAFLAAHLDGRNRVPFAFRWIGGRMVVTHPLRADVPLRPGQVIDAIDGVPAPRLLAQLFALARADGSNDAKRVAMMAVNGIGRFGLFDVYRPLLTPPRLANRVLVSSAGRTLDLPAMTEAERKTGRGMVLTRDGWTFAMRGGVGLLTIPTWAMYNSKWDWRGFLDTSLDRLIDESARGLIVDLRDNEGGEDCGDYLLARLIDRPLPLPRFKRYVRYRRAPAALTPYLDTWDKSFRDWGNAAQPSDCPGLLRLRKADEGNENDRIVPRGRRFAGKVAVLVSATCSSATFQFAQTVKQGGVARLFGTPTGGNQRGINGGAYFFLRLPDTGTEVDLPLIGYYPDGPRPDAGITPDVVLAPTIADLTTGRDRVLAQALRWAG